MSVDIKIQGYLIERLVGKGGMSEVYLAYQEQKPNVPMAVKVMKGAFVGDDNFYKRFQKEISVLQVLDHPNIIKCYGSGKDGDTIYLAMEYLPDPDLKKRIVAGNLSMSNIMRWLREIAAALDYAHTRDFIHRDIKPENVLIRSDGSTALADFGIVRSATSHTKMTGTGMSIGTPYYMSPEQARGRAVDYRSDIYSFGVMVYELLTGEVPYKSEDSLAIGIMHITNPIPVLPDKFKQWQPLLDMMMAKKASQRYQSFNEFIVDLDRLAKNQTTIAATKVRESITDTTHHAPLEATRKQQATQGVSDTPVTAPRTASKTTPRRTSHVPHKTSHATRSHTDRADNAHSQRARATESYNPYVHQKRSGGKLIAFLVIVALLAGSGHYANSHFQLIDRFLASSLTPQQTEIVQSALQRAAISVRRGALFPPAQNNAYSYFVEIATIAPKNDALWAAVQSMTTGAKRPFTQSHISLVKGLYAKGLDGQFFTSDVTRRYVTTMLVFVKQAFDDKRYVTPDKHNAMQYVNDILAHERDNAEAIAWRVRVRQVIYQQVQQVKKSRPGFAERLLRQLLSYDENNDVALTLLNEVTQSGNSNTASRNQNGNSGAVTRPTPAPSPSVQTRPTPTPSSSVQTRSKPTPNSSVRTRPNSQPTSRVDAQPAPSTPSQTRRTATSGSAPSRQAIVEVVNTIARSMVYINDGSFAMGNVTDDAAANQSAYIKELPVQTVFVRGFYMMSREVTFNQYDVFARATNRALPNDNGWGRGNRPVINVSSRDAQAFARWLSQNSKYQFSLPSEAQWEYAARGGTESNYYWGNSLRTGKAQCANCGSIEQRKTTQVGSYAPNPFGLYDMLGNVWEWTSDCWTETLRGRPSNSQPVRTGNCNQRVLRGGSWYDYAESLRVSNRTANSVGNRSRFDGFRLIRR